MFNLFKKEKKKYEFTGKAIDHYGITLRQIKRLSDGLIGGYIEKESNLSHEGNCFVYDNAKVFENVQVFENAHIGGNAIIYGNAQVFRNAYIGGNAHITGNAIIYGDARIRENARVYGNAHISGDAVISGNIKISGYTRLRQNDYITSNNQFIHIAGFSYSITITYCSIHIGDNDYTIDELDNIYLKLNNNEIEVIRHICNGALAYILENNK